jgi:hypothetical protein
LEKGFNALLRYYPQGVDDARYIKDDTEYDIDNKILTKALSDQHCHKWQQYRQDDEQHTAFFLPSFCHLSSSLLVIFSEALLRRFPISLVLMYCNANN